MIGTVSPTTGTSTGAVRKQSPPITSDIVQTKSSSERLKTLTALAKMVAIVVDVCRKKQEPRQGQAVLQTEMQISPE